LIWIEHGIEITTERSAICHGSTLLKVILYLLAPFSHEIKELLPENPAFRITIHKDYLQKETFLAFGKCEMLKFDFTQVSSLGIKNGHNELSSYLFTHAH